MIFGHKFRETEIKKGIYTVVMFYAVVRFMKLHIHPKLCITRPL
jgi:hypothetical protein